MFRRSSRHCLASLRWHCRAFYGSRRHGRPRRSTILIDMGILELATIPLMSLTFKISLRRCSEEGVISVRMTRQLSLVMRNVRPQYSRHSHLPQQQLLNSFGILDIWHGEQHVIPPIQELFNLVVPHPCDTDKVNYAVGGPQACVSRIEPICNEQSLTSSQGPIVLGRHFRRLDDLKTNFWVTQCSERSCKLLIQRLVSRSGSL